MAIGDKLYVADKPTLDSVNTKIGATTDAASSTGGIFARLALNDYYGATILNKNIIVNGSAIKSVQRGVLQMAKDASVTVSISPVNTSKTMVNNLGVTRVSSITDVDELAEVMFYRLNLTDSTTLTSTRAGTGFDNIYISWEVIEYW